MGNNYRSAFTQGDNAQATMPFLKWAGGKQWLAGRLKLSLAKDRTYFEPFLGGGSIFFSLRPASARLGDINKDLIETYSALRDEPRAVIRHLEDWPNAKDVYYAVRGARYRSKSRRAARFIFLNRTCWNGLYRVNRSGEFNVPFGDNAGRRIYEEPNLLRISRLLRKVSLSSGDFQETVAGAGEGDLVYLDPPYTVTRSNNGFRRYNERIFSWEDQKRLAWTAADLVSRGSRVIVSNANHPDVIDLYKGFDYVEQVRQSHIAGSPKFRSAMKEALFTSFRLGRRI